MENIIYRKADDKDIEYMAIKCSILDDDECYVAVSNDNIIGMCRIQKKIYDDDDDELSLACINHSLYDFFIEPDYRMQGIGSNLFNFVYDNLELYDNTARLEFTFVGPENLDFFKKITKDKNSNIEKVCNISQCECYQCVNGLNNYNTDIFFDFNRSTYFCYILKI